MNTVRQFDMIDTIDIARFWIWVEKSEGCWEWVGNKNPAGYGVANTSARTRMAHRLSWFIANGAIPDGIHLDHMCHNPACVRPDHLRLATPKQNAENLLPVRAHSGYRGVGRAGKKWKATVKHDGKSYYSGGHLTPEDANEAAIELRNKLFTHNILDR